MNPLPEPRELAGRSTDPKIFDGLWTLPNPDHILRKAGKSEEIFDAIQSDAHVIGELRLIRADLLRFKHRLVPGGDKRKDQRALELCQMLLDRPPAPMMAWPDAIWNIGLSPFRGQSVHEIVWERTGNEIMPAKLLDRPQRRFRYNASGELRLLTRKDVLFGEPAEDLYFLLNRHMPSYDNPYGLALFSSCFWPYTFKNGGFRWFVKFCERMGIPFPVGTYPSGAGEPEIEKLTEALAALVEAGYAALPEGGQINLLESKMGGGTGKLAQHQLVEASNAEMSKALSSQTLSTEQTGSTGSRGAAEVHRGRSANVGESDRDGIAYTLDRLWALITRINVGEDAKPPRSEFNADEKAGKERAETYEIFINAGGKPSRKKMAADLGIELADPADPEDQFDAPAAPKLNPIATAAAEFARITASEFPDQDAIDAVDIDEQLQGLAQDLLRPLIERVSAGVEPDVLLNDLAALFPKLDDAALQGMLARVIFVGDVWGRLSAQAESSGRNG